MPETLGKKRSRKATAEDADPDKKIKSIKDFNGQLLSSEDGRVATVISVKSAVVPLLPQDRDQPKVSQASITFESPVPKKSEIKEIIEETPFTTALQEKPKQAGGKTVIPSKLVTTLDAVTEEDHIAGSNITLSNPAKQVMYRGSWLCTTLLLFLWVGSSAVLGGLWLHEKLNHKLHSFKLEQDLLDAPTPSEDINVNNKELLALLEKYRLKVIESEGKLQGCKKEFYDALVSLEAK